jgi:hypothetical protein
MTRPRPIQPPLPVSIDFVLAQENAMSTDGNATQQLDPQQAEQVARDLIQNHPHVLAQVFGHEGVGAPPGPGPPGRTG